MVSAKERQTKEYFFENQLNHALMTPVDKAKIYCFPLLFFRGIILFHLDAHKVLLIFYMVTMIYISKASFITEE